MLFKSDDTSIITPGQKALVNDSTESACGFVYNESFAQLSHAIGELSFNQIKYLISDGNWSAIHVLRYLLDYCGPAEVFISSWSISEDSVRSLQQLLISGHLTKVNAIFDNRVKIFTPSIAHYANHNFQCAYGQCHAKITAVTGEKMSAVVIGSANYNNNRRLEAGVLSSHEKDVLYFRDYILLKISEWNCPKNN